MNESLKENEGKWTVSQVIDLTQFTASNVDETDKNFSLPNRLNAGGHVTVGLIGAPEDAEVYIKEMAFFDTYDGAYEYYGDSPTYFDKCFDSKLGKFTVMTVLDGDNLGEWTYDKENAFTLSYTSNGGYGGNYRMMYKFINIDSIGKNKYMRVVYKADNGSSTNKVSLITISPKTGQKAIIESDVQDTNGQWVLSGVAQLTDDLYARLGGTGEYLANETYERMHQLHNSLAFNNTATDAKYGIKNIYFFKTLDDALVFTLPEDIPDPVSSYNIGGTEYDSVTLMASVDTSLAANAYKIYVDGGKLYVKAGSDAALTFAKAVADERVLGGDMYKDVVNIEIASAFVLEGTAPTGNASSNIELKYDDRYTFDKAVARVVSSNITSTNVISGEADVSTLTRVDGETFAASAIGKATVYFTDGTSVTVSVTSAPINVIMLIGQSNTEGVAGNATQSIRNTPGQVYSTYACAGFRYINMCLGNTFTKGLDGLTIYNNDVFIPKSLTGTESRVGADLTYTLGELNKGGFGKGGMDSAIAYEWNKRTGEKVWVINAAHSGSAIQSWLPGSREIDNNFWQAVGVMKSAELTLQDEIAAGHYTLSHMGYFWLQGCSNRTSDPDDYTAYFREMHNGFVSELSFDHDGDPSTENRSIEFAGILLVRTGQENNAASDYYMYGPRLSQYYLGNSAEGSDADIYLISNLGDLWKTDADVANYFTEKYGTEANFRADNAGVKYAMPTTVKEVHPDVHYRQCGYNEIARDAAYNMLCQLGIITPATSEDVTFTLLGSDGLELDWADGITLNAGNSVTIVPVVSPRYKAGDVRMTVSGNITVDNHYVFKSTDGSAATITFSCGAKSVTVKING